MKHAIDLPRYPGTPVADESIAWWGALPMESRRARLHAFRQAQNWLFDAISNLRAYHHGRTFVVEQALQQAEFAQKWLDRGLE